ncbi:MAG: SDR family oxidoreductase [Bacteroidetes bacterium]|nr:SDR family oxidoreductase [Bacteroidota bacterium]
MSSFFENKVVWITGASSGLGEALAKEFASEKTKLILSARRESELQRVKKECSKFILEENILILPLDITELANIDSEVQKVIQKFGRIDILVNNAGVSQRSFIVDTPLDVERKIMEINYFGTVAITKAVLPVMRKQKSGHLVVISSLMGKFGYYRRSSYAASKHALHGYFEALRMEELDNNIHVSLICPGFINTKVSFNAITETGKSFNEMDEGQKNGMVPETCAKKILKAVRNKRVEVFMGGQELMAVIVKRFFPRFFYWRIMQVGPK